MSTLILCDNCKKAIKGENVGQDAGYTVPWGSYKVSLIVIPHCDLCLPCLLEIVTKKPKRKYERKVKPPIEEE
mgnify:CR=1 FL=1